MDKYVHSLLDPFSTSSLAPKLLDGRVDRSAGIKLKATGEYICATDTYSYVVLFPGYSNVVQFYDTTSGVITTTGAFAGHVETATDRALVKSIRSVGTGIKLSLVNNADQNEGYWEAARVPCQTSDFSLFDLLDTGLVKWDGVTGGLDLSNHQTFQSGKLRDLHRYIFKLNSQSNEHRFETIETTTPTVPKLVDEDWDIVVIKIRGRVDGTSPTVLKYEVVSNQELVYVENTSLARLMTHSPYVTHTQKVLERTKFQMPSVQLF